MHTPTCPVKMAGTLQRRCANCQRYRLPTCTLSSGFGFSRSSKGIGLRFHDMPTRLPFDQLLVPVRQIGAHITASRLARYSSALVFLPLEPTEADLEGAAARRRCCATCTRARCAKPAIVFTCGWDAQAADTAGRRMPGRRGQHVRAPAGGRQARAQRPGRRSAVAAAMAAGMSPQAGATRRLNAAIAALQAAAFRFASFKSKPKSRDATDTHRPCRGTKTARS